jgi:hypothetical protein
MRINKLPSGIITAADTAVGRTGDPTAAGSIIGVGIIRFELLVADIPLLWARGECRLLSVPTIAPSRSDGGTAARRRLRHRALSRDQC